MRKLIAAVALLAAVAAGAATIAPGDIAVVPFSFCNTICPPLPPASLLSNALATKAILAENGPAAFASGDRLFVKQTDGVDIYDASLVKSHVAFNPPPAATPSGPRFAAMAVAANGDILVLTFDNDLYIESASGVQKAKLTIPMTVGVVTISGFDLAPDQCTVFAVDGLATIRRFDICTQQPLADVPGTWTAVRALSGGGYVTARQGAIDTFDGHDQLLRSLTTTITEIPTAMAFDVDPAFVWIGGNQGSLDKVRLADGVSVASSGSQSGFLFWMAVNGEQRPATAVRRRRAVAFAAAPHSVGSRNRHSRMDAF